ncbi:hypothetical protein RSJ42_01145 [Methanosarcina hadiensis]|uniref:hypothetical protein n=1 Tax=Methanosarcina hadiensis TaxID=3078083 RepID=UPI0039778232
MKTLKLFGYISVALICVLTLIFIILYYYLETSSSINMLNKVQALTSFLSLLFGSAAAIGGAIATIQAASLGLEISKAQELRDSTAFLEERASNSIKLFSNLLVSISALYPYGISLEHATIGDLDELEKMVTQESPQSVQKDIYTI